MGKRKLNEIQEQQPTDDKNQMMIDNTEEQDTRINQTDRDRMNFRGQQAVEADTDKDTPVQVEFKVNATTKKFNLREALGKLLLLMIHEDKTVKIKASETEEVWNDPNELPVGEAMKEHFKVRQDSNPYESPKVTIYFTVKSKATVNYIKYSPAVINYLKSNQIFLRVDRYQTSKTRSPGYFVNLAPRLLWKPHFIEDIKKQAQRTKFDLHHTVFLDYFSDKGIDHDGGHLPIPDFHIHAANRKFGQVTAEVLMITCAAEDALYFK